MCKCLYLYMNEKKNLMCLMGLFSDIFLLSWWFFQALPYCHDSPNNRCTQGPKENDQKTFTSLILYLLLLEKHFLLSFLDFIHLYLWFKLCINQLCFETNNKRDETTDSRCRSLIGSIVQRCHLIIIWTFRLICLSKKNY